MNNYQLSSVHETNLTNQNGVYQDSLLTYAADRSGRFWALLGHTNLGGISVWSGSSLLDLKKEYDAQYCFALGEAGQAFSGIPYPDGPLSRGQIWPCGLWINKETNRFYCLIHNETGWGAGKTSYTARAQEEGEPDFRHTTGLSCQPTTGMRGRTGCVPANSASAKICCTGQNRSILQSNGRMSPIRI